MPIATRALDLSTPRLFAGTMPYVGDSRYKLAHIEKSLLVNFKLGCRHVDTAELYREALPYVRSAIQKSKIPRKNLFIASKLNGMSSSSYDEIKDTLEQHLTALGIKYVDLLYIHWPGLAAAKDDLNPDPTTNPAPAAQVSAIERLRDKCAWAHFDAGIEKTWENFQRLKEAGLIRNIGVSNFYQQHVQRLLQFVDPSEIFANQIYLDATHHELDFVKQMQVIGINVVAYRPLQFLHIIKTIGDMNLFDMDRVEDAESQETETTYQRLKRLKIESNCETVEQMIIASLLSRGVSVCTKTSNPVHARANFRAVQKASTFPEDVTLQLPMPTDAVITFLAYDEWAEVFKLA